MEDPGGGDPEQQRWPIGFILLVVAAAAYLLLRFIQIGAWVLERIAG
jgi:hypothetical protein